MLAERVQKIGFSPTLAVSDLATRMRAEGIDVLDFSAGQPDFPTFGKRQGRRPARRSTRTRPGTPRRRGFRNCVRRWPRGFRAGSRPDLRAETGRGLPGSQGRVFTLPSWR